MSYYEFHGLDAQTVESMAHDLEGARAVHLVDYLGNGMFTMYVLGEVPDYWENSAANSVDPKWRDGDPIYEALVTLLNNIK